MSVKTTMETVNRYALTFLETIFVNVLLDITLLLMALTVQVSHHS